MSAAQPQFSLPIREPIINHLTGQPCQLVSVDAADRYGAAALEDIATICNQPLVYDLLFAERFQGRTYTPEDAAGFLRWGADGWMAGSHFLFFITTAAGKIVGAADIKSPNLAAAEIGYWMDAEHPGAMTNTVIKLCQIAQQAGYQSLVAFTKAHNHRSAAVLERAGFTYAADCTRSKQLYRQYSRKL